MGEDRGVDSQHESAQGNVAPPEGVPNLEILHQDEWLAVVNKPAGLVVHPAPSYQGTTLVDQMRHLLAGGSDPDRPGIVHRLDKDTSGVLVVALRDEVLGDLQELIRSRRLTRRYLALVRGRPDSESGTIEAPIGRSAKDRQRMTVGGAAPREAVTHFEVLEDFGESSLLGVELETGRTHQIRVHMAAIGHPVLGDSTYGAGPMPLLERQFLHSSRIEFPHPRTGDQVAVESPLPADLTRCLNSKRPDADAVRPDLGTPPDGEKS